MSEWLELGQFVAIQLEVEMPLCQPQNGEWIERKSAEISDNLWRISRANRNKKCQKNCDEWNVKLIMRFQELQNLPFLLKLDLDDFLQFSKAEIGQNKTAKWQFSNPCKLQTWFHNFSATWHQFLSFWRHISCYFDHSSSSEFWNFDNLWHFKVWIFPKMKVKSLQKGKNGSFWSSEIDFT